MCREPAIPIKCLRLGLGMTEREDDYITLEIRTDDDGSRPRLDLYEGGGNHPGDPHEPKFYYEDIEEDAIIAIRDFLNYAVPPK